MYAILLQNPFVVIYAFFGVNFSLQRYCLCKTNDKYEVCMCRTQTKGATVSKIKDKNFAIKQELERMGLSKRVCQIFAAQAGVAARADGSLVQRIGHFLKENNLTSVPLRFVL